MKFWEQDLRPRADSRIVLVAFLAAGVACAMLMGFDLSVPVLAGLALLPVFRWVRAPKRDGETRLAPVLAFPERTSAERSAHREAAKAA